MWMDGKKLQVHPQKRLYTWINIMNSDCCHKKEPGASAYKKAPGFFGGDKRKAVAAVWKWEQLTESSGRNIEIKAAAGKLWQLQKNRLCALIG